MSYYDSYPVLWLIENPAIVAGTEKEKPPAR